MTAFSRNTTNEINWDGVANLTLTDVSVGVIILTGDPGSSTGSGTELFLPPTQNTTQSYSFAESLSSGILDFGNTLLQYYRIIDYGSVQLFGYESKHHLSQKNP